jgi:hypothetical protein
MPNFKSDGVRRSFDHPSRVVFSGPGAKGDLYAQALWLTKKSPHSEASVNGMERVG